MIELDFWTLELPLLVRSTIFFYFFCLKFGAEGASFRSALESLFKRGNFRRLSVDSIIPALTGFYRGQTITSTRVQSLMGCDEYQRVRNRGIWQQNRIRQSKVTKKIPATDSCSSPTDIRYNPP